MSKPSEPDDPIIASALAMMDAGASSNDVGAALNVSPRTVRRWRLRWPAKASVAEKALENVKTEALSTVANTLRRLAVEAEASLARLVDERDNFSEGTPDSRIRAAVALLDRAGIVGGVKVEHGGSIAAPTHDRAAVLASIEARAAAQDADNGPSVAK